MSRRIKTTPGAPPLVAAEWRDASVGSLQRAPADTRARAIGSDARATAAVGGESKSRRTWWAQGLRVVRDAAIGLALVVALPLCYVERHGDRIWQQSTKLPSRLSSVERLRPLMLPRDGTLSAADAGRVFHSLESPRDRSGFPMRPAEAPVVRGWKIVSVSDDVLERLRTPGALLPRPSAVLAAAARGLTSQDLEYLRTVAESPVWGVVDQLVRSREVDLVGGRFALPFGATVSPHDMPAVRDFATKQLARAGVARAAYHVARGDYARAEEALRVSLSFGFLLMDNGSQQLDGLIGAVMVEIGRDGLRELYRITGDVSAATRVEPSPRMTSMPNRAHAPRGAPEVTRGRLLAELRDPTVSRTQRQDALLRLATGTCGSVRGVLFGHPDDTEAAFRAARVSVARFPSEQALVDLLRETPNRPVSWEVKAASHRLLMSAARVAGVLSGNPRVVACTQMVAVAP